LAPGSCRPLEGHLLVCPHTAQMTAGALPSEYVNLTPVKADGRRTRCSVQDACTARPGLSDQDFIRDTTDRPTAVSVNDHVLRYLYVDGGRVHSLPSLPQCRPLAPSPAQRSVPLPMPHAIPPPIPPPLDSSPHPLYPYPA